MEERQISVLAAQGFICAARAVIAKAGLRGGAIGVEADELGEFSWQQGLNFFLGFHLFDCTQFSILWLR